MIRPKYNVGDVVYTVYADGSISIFQISEIEILRNKIQYCSAGRTTVRSECDVFKVNQSEISDALGLEHKQCQN